LRLRIIKISSGDINNYPLLEIISKFAKKVILSTGMSTLLEIKNAIRILKRNNLLQFRNHSDYYFKKPM
jgi:sialic acid synthase SpsE